MILNDPNKLLLLAFKLLLRRWRFLLLLAGLDFEIVVGEHQLHLSVEILRELQILLSLVAHAAVFAALRF